MVHEQDYKPALSVKEIREILDLNQEEFSVACGLTKGHLANIENFTRNFTYSSAKRIADALQNILERARNLGEGERSSGSKVKQLGDNWGKESWELQESPSSNNERIIIHPEMIISSHSASAFEKDVQERAYKILIDIEISKIKLSLLKNHGNNYIDDSPEITKPSAEFSRSPSEITATFLSDKYNKQALDGIVEEFKHHMRGMEGYFLSREKDEDYS